MKFPRILFGCLVAMTTGAFAAAPATNAPPAPAKTPAAPAPGPVLPSQPGELKFSDYLNDLATTLKLSDDEKKEVEGYYLADGVALKNILNDDSISPLQQAKQVADLRGIRNAKIEALFEDVDRKHEFSMIEAKYRVALTELAAEGGLIPAQNPAATTAPPPAPAAPAPAAPDAAK